MKKLIFICIMLMTVMSFANEPPSFDSEVDNLEMVVQAQDSIASVLSVNDNVIDFTVDVSCDTRQSSFYSDSYNKRFASTKLPKEDQENPRVDKKVDPGWGNCIGYNQNTKLDTNSTSSSSGGLPRLYQ